MQSRHLVACLTPITSTNFAILRRAAPGPAGVTAPRAQVDCETFGAPMLLAVGARRLLLGASLATCPVPIGLGLAELYAEVCVCARATRW